MSPKESQTSPLPKSNALSSDDAESKREAGPEKRPGSPHAHLSVMRDHSTSQTGGFFQKGEQYEQWLRTNRDTSGTTNSSPTDPAYVPQKQSETFRKMPSVSDTQAAPPNVAQTDERSFFNFDSESDESLEDGSQPVFGRASSVKIAKPNVIQCFPGVRDPKPLASTQNLEVPNSNSSTPLAVEPLDLVYNSVLPAGSETQGALERAKAYRMLTGESSNEITAASITALPPTSTTDTIIANTEPQNAANEMAYQLQTRPTVLSVHAEIDNVSDLINTNSESPALSVLNNEDRTLPASDAAASMQTPISPSGKTQKRVTIKPPDLDTTNARDKAGSFRQSVVSTPYPASIDEDVEDFGSQEKNNALVSSAIEDIPASIQPQKFAASSEHSGEKDRFPSPERSEVLFLDLGMANQPDAKTILEIQVFDKSTFDDAVLFRQIRAAYFRKLLGSSRLAFSLIRCIGHATAVFPKTSADFDGIDFIRLFRKPGLGYKRKTWTIWLRNQNAFTANAQLHAWDISKTPQPKTPVRQITNLNRLSLRTRPASTQHGQIPSGGVNNKSEEKRLSALSTASSFNFTYAPLTTARIPFLSKSADHSPSSPATCHSFFKTASSISPSPETPKAVTVTLHHRFSFLMVSFMLFCTLLASVASTTLWIVFGPGPSVPGRAIHGGAATMADGFHRKPTQWTDDASVRVLTGLVLGLAVLLLGGVVNFAVIWGGWLLL